MTVPNRLKMSKTFENLCRGAITQNPNETREECLVHRDIQTAKNAYVSLGFFE